MNLIQELWNFLYFIDNHPGIGRKISDHGLKGVGVLGKLQVEGGIEEIKKSGLRQNLPQPGGLAHASWAKKEEGTRLLSPCRGPAFAGRTPRAREGTRSFVRTGPGQSTPSPGGSAP